MTMDWYRDFYTRKVVTTEQQIASYSRMMATAVELPLC